MSRLNITVAALVLFSVVNTQTACAQDARADAVVVRAVERMEGYDYNSNAKVKAAIARHIERSKGTADFLRLLKKFKPQGMEQEVQSRSLIHI